MQARELLERQEQALFDNKLALQRQSENKLIRQAYQRRKDEIYFHNKELADNMRMIEQANAEIKQAENEKLRAQLTST